MSGPGIVTGLPQELRCLDVFAREAGRPLARCEGIGPDAAARAAAALVRDGCDGLVSFGLAGGLELGLCRGDIVLAHTVRSDGGESWTTDAAWRARLRACLATGPIAVCEGVLYGSDVPVLSATAKYTLAARTSAIAVDMESHAVARVAHAAGLPFLVLRAIADPPERHVPEWIPSMVDAKGRPNLPALLRRLLRRPGDLRALLRLAADARSATASLRRCALDAGPGFALG